MNRLHKKCLAFSVGLHVLLLSVLVVGPAFLPAPAPPQEITPLDFIPSKLVDDAISGGGSPAPAPAGPPRSSPPAPKPAPMTPPPETKPPVEAPKPPTPPPKERDLNLAKPVVRNEPSVAVEEPKFPTEENPDAVQEIERKPKREINLTPVVRKPPRNNSRSRKQTDDSQAEQMAAAAAAANAWRQSVGRALGTIRSGLSGNVSIDGIGTGGTGTGGSGGGEATANWAQAVYSIYVRAWNPDVDADESMKVVARVTVRRDGSVDSDEIVRRSPSPDLNRSVSDVLARVRSLPPFPASAKDRSRVLNITFDLRAKRLLLQ